jgi:carbamoyltransferase
LRLHGASSMIRLLTARDGPVSRRLDRLAMNVLGIHDGHDAGVCLIRDGRIVAFSSEERRRNVKNWAGPPDRSIAAVLKRSGLEARDIDLIAVSGRIRTTVPTRDYQPMYSVLTAGAWLARGETSTRAAQWLLRRMRKRRELLAALRQFGLDGKPLSFFDHHATHAATAFFHRPWKDDALVLTLDGAGDGLCATAGIGSGTKLRVIASTPKYHSPAAHMYSAITAHLGMRPYEHEYKIMGMAPYGQAEHCIESFRQLFSVDGLKFRNHTGRIGSAIQRFYARELYGQRFDNVSAACQLVFEDLMLKWVRNAVAATGVHKLACAGGGFLNVKANKLIRELPEVEAFYAYPASDDGGTPIGAAILGYLELCETRSVAPELSLPRDMYLGLEFTDEEMEEALLRHGLPYVRMQSPAKEVARLLADGEIVGRFAGREEAGPRALGNRSILADPRDLRVIRKLNFAIKYRDFWMPFAASILEEDVPKYIERPGPWPYYMIEAFDTLPDAGRAIIAGMHPFDLTVRPQVVNDLNPEYRDLIREFKALTGVGAVLNTSFNLHGFPIVGTLDVALQTLRDSDLDAIALGPFLSRKQR